MGTIVDLATVDYPLSINDCAKQTSDSDNPIATSSYFQLPIVAKNWKFVDDPEFRYFRNIDSVKVDTSPVQVSQRIRFNFGQLSVSLYLSICSKSSCLMDLLYIKYI
jgi:hypothetical protein